MAQGNQSKEGLFEILFTEMKEKGFSSGMAQRQSIGIIDHVIDEDVRENKSNLVIALRNLGEALIVASVKI